MNEIRELISRTHNRKAEEAVLGTALTNIILLNKVVSELTEDDFLFEEHRALFRILTKMVREVGDEMGDFKFLLHSYIKAENLEDLLTEEYLESLIEQNLGPNLLEAAISTLKKFTIWRRVLELCDEAIEAVKVYQDPNTILDKLLNRGLAISMKQEIEEYVVSEHAWEYFQKLLERMETGEITGVPSGFEELDKITHGFQKKELTIIAARPGMGKSAYMINIAVNNALAGRKSVIFSLEMTKEQIMDRIFSIVSKVKLSSIRSAHFTEEEIKILEKAVEETISKLEIIIIDNPLLTIADIKAKVRKLKLERGIDIVFIDYLQKITPNAPRNTKQEEIAEITQQLKNLAKELDIPVVALAQLSREPERRSDRRPVLADLRESGQIEQEADVVIFLYRPGYYKKNATLEDKKKTEIIVAKNRQGETGSFEMIFDPLTTSFYKFEPKESTRSKNNEGEVYEDTEDTEEYEDTWNDNDEDTWDSEGDDWHRDIDF